MPSEPGQWVTKSQLRQYEMCPYTYWLLYTRAISPSDVFGELEELIVPSGVQFEADLIEDFPEAPDDTTPEELAKTAQFLFNVETMSNEARKIAGRPDGIELSTFAPIEVKSHNKIRPIDRLELAFYWLLLEEQREDKALAPYGWVCRPHYPEPVRVALRSQDFARVEYLINAVRVAREKGVSPRVCYCNVCYRRTEVVELYERKEDVRLIWGVGPQNARLLEEAGVATLRSLVEADAEGLTRS